MKKDSDPMGWRIAAITVLGAALTTAGAYAIHLKTDCDPTHPTCMKISSAPAHADDSHDAGHAGDTHAPAAGGAAGDSHAHTDTSAHTDTAAHKATTPGKSGH
jgi:hypothetical protein